MTHLPFRDRFMNLIRRVWLWPQMGLSFKMALIVSIGLLALIILFGYMGTTALNENIQRSLEERVVLAQTMARHVDYLLANVEHALTDAAQEGGLADPNRRVAVLRTLYANLNFYGNQLLLVDRDNRVVAAYPPRSADLILPEAQSIQLVLNGEAFAVSRRAHTLDGGAPSPLAVAPVRDEKGNIVAALVLSIDFYRPNLPAFTHPVGLGDTGYVDIVDMDGLILGSTRPQYIGKTSDHNTSLAKMIAAGQTTVSRCHDCHEASTIVGTVEPERQVLAFAPLTRAPWGVTVRQNEDEVLETASTLRLRVFEVGVIALLGALVLVYLTTHSVISPVQALTVAARRITTGDLDTPIAARGSDEVGVLAQAFDAMRAKLKGSISEIQSFNRALDARVQERTAALEAAQREVRLSRDHLQTIIDNLGDELIVVDRDYRVTRVNAVVEQNHPAGAALIGARCYEATHAGAPCQEGESRCPLPLVLETGKRQRTMHVHGHNGDTRYTELTASPLRDSTGQVSGVVELRRDVTEEKRVALENARLYQELSHKEELRGELVRRLISAQEDERKRIARELHDETSQILTTLLFTVDTAAESLQTPDAEPVLEDMRALTRNALDGVHNMIFDLRPTMLDQLGLVAALRSYAKARLGELGLHLEFTEGGRLRRLPWVVETALFRTIQEAINNVARHSGARRVDFAFDFQEDRVEIRVQDDGVGFDPKQIAASPDSSRGLGLLSMQERITAVGGEFFLVSTPGQGTLVRVRVPVREEQHGSHPGNDR